jgi:hypothetical protein
LSIMMPAGAVAPTTAAFDSVPQPTHLLEPLVPFIWRQHSEPGKSLAQALDGLQGLT